MAECVGKDGKRCPAFYECSQEGMDATGAGWKTVPMGDREVILCRPAKSRGGKANHADFLLLLPCLRQKQENRT